MPKHEVGLQHVCTLLYRITCLAQLLYCIWPLVVLQWAWTIECAVMLLVLYRWSRKTDVTLPWVWSQTGLVLDAAPCVWGSNMMRFADVTFSVMKFHIMKRKWCDISGCHSGVSEDLFFCGVTCFGWVLFDVSMYPCTFMLILDELKNKLTVWTLKMEALRSFETWRTTHWTRLRHIEKDLKFQQTYVWEFVVLWTPVCRYCPHFLRHWHLYVHAGNTSKYLAYLAAVVGLTQPRSLVIAVKLKSHSLGNTTSHSARGYTPPRILNPAFDRSGTVARFSLLDSGGSCPAKPFDRLSGSQRRLGRGVPSRPCRSLHPAVLPYLTVHTRNRGPC